MTGSIGVRQSSRDTGHHRDSRASKKPNSILNKSGNKETLAGGDDENKENEQESDEMKLQNQPSVRNIFGFIEKYDRVEVQELLSQMNCHWLLSLEDFKLPIEHPHGLITQMTPVNDDNLYILMPFESGVGDLEYREIHQILRELTIGMYVLNQHPYLQLEANFDESTSCQMPPGYIDTKLGQIMINTDYWLKALWHGAFFPREKRKKFCERFRPTLDVDSNGIAQTKKNMLDEFVNAGMSDIARDEEYGAIFKSQTGDEASYPFGVGMNLELQSRHKAAASDGLTEKQRIEGTADLINCIDDISVQLTFGLKSIKNFKNMYEIESDYFLNCACKSDNERVNNAKFESIKPILNLHEKFLRDNFEKKLEVRRNLVILKLVSFLVPLLVSLKKRMKIPDMNNLLPPLSGEEVHTERELPPLMYSSDFKSKLFGDLITDQNKFFNLHGGIQFELETATVEQDKVDEIKREYDRVASHGFNVLKEYLEAEQQNEYKVPVIEIKNKKYWCFRIDLEAYYYQYPQKPYWVYKLNDELVKLRPRRLPMSDIQIYDLFKKYFGYKRATKYKAIPMGLRAGAERGLIGVFHSFMRRTQQSRLTKQDELGYGLLHYAAIHNRPAVATTLMMLSADINIKQQIDYLAVGPLPVHYAARCSSMDTLTCLLANFSNLNGSDNEGWTPIHYAAYFDNIPALLLILRKQKELLEITTRGESRKTPLLVAASAGSLEAVKCLINQGANISYHDENGYNLIHHAAHKNRANIIDYFIKTQYPELPTWNLLINMLANEKETDVDSSVKCLLLLTNGNRKAWSPILNAGGIEKLFSILRKYSVFLAKKPAPVPTPTMEDEEENNGDATPVILKPPPPVTSIHTIALNTLSVLCNISDQHEVRNALSKISDVTTILIKILEMTTNEDAQSRTCILIGDVATADESLKVSFAKQDCLVRLLNLLNTDYEDLLVNTVNTIEIMCRNNLDNKNYCCENNIFECFKSLLKLNSDFIKSSVSAAVSAITHDNQSNQLLAMSQGIIKPICDLLKSRNITVQLKASMAIESLAINNQQTQNMILESDASSYLIRLLEDHTTLTATFNFIHAKNHQSITVNLEYGDDLHVVMTMLVKNFLNFKRMYYVGATIKSNMEDWSIIVREQSALTLWALAGSLRPQRKLIAEKIGIQQIVNMLMAKSEKLQFVGAKCMISLILENKQYQNMILKENGVDPLIKLLKLESASHRVILGVVETIGAMCVDIAHVNNYVAQDELNAKETISLLLEMMNNPPSRIIQIEATHAIACMLLNRGGDEEIKVDLDIKLIVDLIKTDDLDLRLKAGLAIAVLAFNNHEKQYEIKKNGGISYEWYREYIENENINPMFLCRACFQIVVLARVIFDRSQVWLTAVGISRLVELLLHPNDLVVIQTASYMSSLAHTRAGITDAMITCDAVDILCDLLYSSNGQVRHVSAIALGYLSFNRTASRLLLHNCRNVTHLFDTLMQNLKSDSKISRQFIESYETALELGLPKLLVNNKIKFLGDSRCKSAAPARRQDSFSGFYKGSRNFSDNLVRNIALLSGENDEENRMRRESTFVERAHRAQSAPMKLKKNSIPASAVAKGQAEDKSLNSRTAVKPVIMERPKTHSTVKRINTKI